MMFSLAMGASVNMGVDAGGERETRTQLVSPLFRTFHARKHLGRGHFWSAAAADVDAAAPIARWSEAILRISRALTLLTMRLHNRGFSVLVATL